MSDHIDDVPVAWRNDDTQQSAWTLIMQGYAEKLAKAGLDASPALWEQFCRHLERYQHIEDTDMARVLDVDVIKNRVYTAIEEGELDVTSSPVTIKQISGIVIDQIKRSPRPEQGRRIIPMKESQRPDQWYDIIKAATEEFVAENGFTPYKDELWSRLTKNPPKDFVVVHKNRVLTNSDDKRLDQKNFTARYKDYFGITSE